MEIRPSHPRPSRVVISFSVQLCDQFPSEGFQAATHSQKGWDTAWLIWMHNYQQSTETKLDANSYTNQSTTKWCRTQHGDTPKLHGRDTSMTSIAQWTIMRAARSIRRQTATTKTRVHFPTKLPMPKSNSPTSVQLVAGQFRTESSVMRGFISRQSLAGRTPLDPAACPGLR